MAIGNEVENIWKTAATLRPAICEKWYIYSNSFVRRAKRLQSEQLWIQRKEICMIEKILIAVHFRKRWKINATLVSGMCENSITESKACRKKTDVALAPACKNSNTDSWRRWNNAPINIQTRKCDNELLRSCCKTGEDEKLKLLLSSGKISTQPSAVTCINSRRPPSDAWRTWVTKKQHVQGLETAGIICF